MRARKLSYETYAELYGRLLRGSAADLEDVLPGLVWKLEVARAVSAKYWTDSTQFEGSVESHLLPDTVLDGLGIRHETTRGVVHVPAGIMHTYGYLFSQLRTRRGLKGKRWIEDRLDERLGLPAGTFGPLAKKGEFASNVTAAFLRLTGEKPKLSYAAKFKISAKARGCLEQRISWKNGMKALVHTHLVPLKKLSRHEGEEAFLLIYSLVQSGKRRLVTGFPVDDSYASTIMNAPAGKSSSFAPRYNLYVDPSWKVAAQESRGFMTRSGASSQLTPE
ncbi:MAG: hypothetical protein ACHQ49_17495 [Elusimicrobiota bacterium]